MNNVDLRDGFRLGNTEVAILAATNRTDKTRALYGVDGNGRLSDVADGKTPRASPIRPAFACIATAAATISF